MAHRSRSRSSGNGPRKTQGLSECSSSLDALELAARYMQESANLVRFELTNGDMSKETGDRLNESLVSIQCSADSMTALLANRADAQSAGQVIRVTTAFGPWGQLALDWPCEIDIDGMKWTSLDHYYQSMKFWKHDDAVYDEVRQLEFTDLVVQKAKEEREKKRPDWKDVKRSIMARGLREKFQQNAGCRASLLDTGTKRLILDDPRCTTEHYWAGRGQNVFGILLEGIRTELMQLPVRFFMPWHASQSPATDDMREHGILSNQYPLDPPMIIDSLAWRTVEHYFQAQKFVGNLPAQEEIRAAHTALQAHNLGREQRTNRCLREDWDRARVGCMLHALRCKFLQNRACREFLLSTGERRLIYSACTDQFWGIGLGGGGNKLGGLMEIVRSEFNEYKRPATVFTRHTQAYMSVPAIAAKAKGEIAVSEFNFVRDDFEEGAEVVAADIGPEWDSKYQYRLEKRMVVVYDAHALDPHLYRNGFQYMQFPQPLEDSPHAVYTALLTLRQSLLPGGSRKDGVAALHAALKIFMPMWWNRVDGDAERPAADLFVPLDGICRSTKPGSSFGPVGLVHIDFPHVQEAIETFGNNPWPLPSSDCSVVDMVNIWIPLDDVCRGHPLACLDTTTFDEKRNVCYTAKRAGGSHFRAVGPRWNAGQYWYSLKNWKFGTAVIFRSVASPHSAFHDGSDCHRQSIEVRGYMLKLQTS